MRSILAILGLTNIIMAFAVISQWDKLGKGAAKVMMFICLMLFPALWGTAVITHNLNTAKSVSFCESCHIMQPYVESLQVDDDEPLSAVHYQNNWIPQEEACYACHTTYTLFGGLKSKIAGLRHMYVYYIKGAPEKLKMYEQYQNSACLRCHGMSKKFKKTKKHHKTKKMMSQIMEGQKSCLARSCHELGHLIEDESDDDIIF
jgi:nitrate/TMAO reductase-like tetraheme cytochrome c subunit